MNVVKWTEIFLLAASMLASLAWTNFSPKDGAQANHARIEGRTVAGH
jgi:hypothetical protein